MIRSDGIATDLLVMRGLTEVTDCGSHLIFHTPSEPNYWFGNCIIMREPLTQPDAVIDLFRSAFPEARHVCVQWDIDGLKFPDADTAGFKAMGFDVDDCIFLATDDVQNFALPDGITARPLEGEDWDKALDLMCEIGEEEGYGGPDHRRYLTQRNIGRREQIARGEGQWFGAFDGETIVADLGIFHDEHVARYQSVETRASYRQRGICAALLGEAYRWMRARAPEARVLIATDAHGAARRVYERVGFTPHERIMAVMKRVN